ncbi:unnamed protein product [Hermetia illucens]|uniref:Gustatory receptor n=1 Tax=Hermetia illucens TaxID=343691 RepID=A0A7R8USU9_HERIL|nr:unnamed protein product [Hermetia illucens]
MTVLMESFLQRKKLEGFFAKLQTLHDKYPVKCRNTGRPRILWEIYVLFIYLAAYEVNLYHAIADDKPLVRLWMTVESSSIPLLFHYCQSILFLEFIRVELIKLNKDLSDIIMFASHTNNPRCPELFEEYLRKRIVKAQKRYQIIYEMVQGLNDFFGTSWAVTTVNTAISCECCIYWIYWEFYNKVVYHALGEKFSVPYTQASMQLEKFRFVNEALLHYFQSILFLELVRLELVKLNKSLKDIIVFTTSQDGAGSRGIFIDYLKKRIVKTQKRYQIIYGMVQELNEFFGLSWAIGVVNTAVTSEILFYWVYWGLHFGIFYNAVELIPLVLSYIVVPLFFLLRADKCINESKKSASLLHKLQCDLKDRSLSVKIRNFSLQLSHEKIAFDAGGYFSMDTQLLKAV